MLHLGLLGNNYSETDEEEEKETIDDENNSRFYRLTVNNLLGFFLHFSFYGRV